MKKNNQNTLSVKELVKQLQVVNNAEVEVTIKVTAPNCPAINSENKVKLTYGVNNDNFSTKVEMDGHTVETSFKVKLMVKLANLITSFLEMMDEFQKGIRIRVDGKKVDPKDLI